MHQTSFTVGLGNRAVFETEHGTLAAGSVAGVQLLEGHFTTHSQERLDVETLKIFTLYTVGASIDSISMHTKMYFADVERALHSIPEKLGAVSLANAVHMTFQEGVWEVDTPARLWKNFTDRQLSIVKGHAAGKGNSEIAEELGVYPGAVVTAEKAARTRFRMPHIAGLVLVAHLSKSME